MLELQLEQADVVLGCSEYIAEGVRRRFPSIADRCHTVYNGVQIEQFERPRQPSCTRRLLFVGRLSPEKGLHVLADAFNQVVNQFPDAELHIIGGAAFLPYAYHVGISTDPKVKALRRFYGESILAKVNRQLLRSRTSYLADVKRRLSASAGPRVHFHGALPHRDIAEHYARADVFIFPSVWPEPFGIPVVEAMASRLPVVATSGGGIDELVVPGETGLLVGREEADELARALSDLLVDEEARHSMGEAGHQRARERFTWERAAAQLLKVLEGASA